MTDLIVSWALGRGTGSWCSSLGLMNMMKWGVTLCAVASALMRAGILACARWLDKTLRSAAVAACRPNKSLECRQGVRKRVGLFLDLAAATRMWWRRTLVLRLLRKRSGKTVMMSSAPLEKWREWRSLGAAEHQRFCEVCREEKRINLHILSSRFLSVL